MELMAGDIAFDSEQDINLPFESRKRKFLSMHSRDSQTWLNLFLG